MSAKFWKSLVLILIGLILGGFIYAKFICGDSITIGKVKVKGKGNTQQIEITKK